MMSVTSWHKIILPLFSVTIWVLKLFPRKRGAVEKNKDRRWEYRSAGNIRNIIS